MTPRQLDPRLSFDEVPEIYDAARPEYPHAAFEDAFRYLREKRPGDSPAVVEIGPGTGQATGELLACGARVTAIEIGPRLAGFLRRKFADQPRLHVVNESFEQAALPHGAWDMVLAATSFHWLDPAARVRKATELLARGAALVTLSTIQIRSEADRGYFDRTFEIYRKWRHDERNTAAPAEDEAVPGDFEEFRASGLLGDVAMRRYRWDQTYTTDSYERLVRSYSNTQTMESDDREGLIADLRRVIESEYDGRVVRPLVIAVTLARRQ